MISSQLGEEEPVVDGGSETEAVHLGEQAGEETELCEPGSGMSRATRPATCVPPLPSSLLSSGPFIPSFLRLSAQRGPTDHWKYVPARPHLLHHPSLFTFLTFLLKPK